MRTWLSRPHAPGEFGAVDSDPAPLPPVAPPMRLPRQNRAAAGREQPVALAPIRLERPSPAAAAPPPDSAARAPAEPVSHDATEAPVRKAAPPPGAVGGPAPDLYLAHFGLSERPFALQPDPDFLFWSPAHRRAFSILEYGLMTRAPITLVTGEIGAGKTTLLHHLLRSLAAEVQPALISNAKGAHGDLLRLVLMALGQPADPQAGPVDLFAAFQRYLIDQYAAGRRVVLIFDEAQTLDRETLEELRLFTNINAGKDELVQLILVGQPELRGIIARPDMAQFAQRVAASFHLPAMDGATLRAYVGHRLAVAGATRELFEPDALALVQDASRGVPRLVNQLCDLALVYAFGGNQQTVSRHTVRHVLDDGVFFGASPASTEGGGDVA